MALKQWEPMGIIEWPERWRRWLDFDTEPEGWMKVEEVQEDRTLVVRAELPGLDPDKDVEMSVSDGVLHISAKREDRNEKKEKGRYRSEFRYGEFSRDLALPVGVDSNKVDAKYFDGILEVRVPWKDEKQPEATKVPISRS